MTTPETHVQDALVTRPPVRAGLAYSLLVLTMLTWAGGAIVGRAVHEQVPPIGLSYWRWCTTAILLAPFCWSRLRAHAGYLRAHWRHIVALGVFMTLGGTLFLYALQYTTASNVTLVNGTQPVITAVIAWMLLKDRLTGTQVLGVVAAMGGVVVMVSRMDVQVLRGLEFNPGDLLMVFAVISYSSYAVNLHRWIHGVDLLLLVFLVSCVGAVWLLPLYLAESLFVRSVPMTLQVVGAVLFLALVPSLLGGLTWNKAIRAVGANRAAIFVNLLPVFGTSLAALLLGEHLHDYHLYGALLVCTGITLVVTAKRTG